MATDSTPASTEPADAGLRLVPERTDIPQQLPVEQQFVNFLFLRINPEWRKLAPDTKRVFKSEFENVYGRFREDFLLYSYSLVGFDSKADLMLWRVGTSLDLVQEMTAGLFKTNLGSYLETADTYMSVTKKRMFVDIAVEDRHHVRGGTTKYLFFYPCAKHSEWYDLPIEERDALVEENFMVGKRFPNIKIHLTHAFGFNENEYLISFETDEPRDFLALAEELRQTPASKWTLRGMPIYTCRQRSLTECLDALG